MYGFLEWDSVVVVDLQEVMSESRDPLPPRPQNVVSCQNPERCDDLGPLLNTKLIPDAESTPRFHSLVLFLGLFFIVDKRPSSSSHILRRVPFPFVFLGVNLDFMDYLRCFLAAKIMSFCLCTINQNRADLSSAVMSVSAFFL